MSSRSLSSPKFSVKITGTYINTLDDGSEVKVSQPSLNYAPTLSNGLGANQVNRAWQAKNQNIDSGDQVTIDVESFTGFNIGGGVDKDALGQDLMMEEIVSIVIVNENDSTADGKLEIIPSASEGWPPIGEHTVYNGGALDGGGLLAKVNVSADAFDITPIKHRITLRAVGGSVSYSIYIQGRSDDDESSSSSSSSLSSSVSSSSQSESSSSQSTSSSSESTSSQSSSSASS